MLWWWQAKLSLSSVFAGMFPLNIQPSLSAGWTAHETGAQLLASYRRGITVKGSLRIKLHLYLQELLGKNIAIDRDVAGFDQRKKPSINSNALTLSQLIH